MLKDIQRFTLEKCVIEGNRVPGMENWNGAGIYVDMLSSDMCLITNCIVRENGTVGYTPQYGGGIYYCGNVSGSGNFRIEDSLIVSNYSKSNGGGGGIAARSVGAANINLIVTSCTIRDNTTYSGSGGGIFSDFSRCELKIHDSGIIGNKAGAGGGLYVKDNNKDVEINRCVIADNTAANNGGGIYIEDSSGPLLQNCVMTDNHAANGGGLSMTDSIATMINCTFTTNTAITHGGAVVMSAGAHLTLERFMIFAYDAESRSRALGQTANGEFTNWDLQANMGYDDQHYSHSREFRSHIADEWEFWERAFNDCQFQQP